MRRDAEVSKAAPGGSRSLSWFPVTVNAQSTPCAPTGAATNSASAPGML